MKHFIIIGIFSAFNFFSFAQISDNSLSINIGVGKNEITHDLIKGEYHGGIGNCFAVEFQHFFNKWIGIKTGIIAQSYTSMSILSFKEETFEYDSEGDFRLFKTVFNNWHEEQQLKNYEFPLCLSFKVSFNQRFNANFSFGAKMSLPLSASFKTIGGEMKTSAYYPLWNVELYDLPKYGFDTFTNEFNGTFKVKTGYAGIFEIGSSYHISDRLFLTAKFYYNYGLNNILESEKQSLYLTSGIYNGVFSSKYVNELTLVAYGLNFGLGYSL